MSPRLSWIAAALCLSAVGCDDGATVELTPSDAGPVRLDGALDMAVAPDSALDSGLDDSGLDDSGLDAGRDAGVMDGALMDASVPDAEVPDAVLSDAEASDAEIADSGLLDAEISDAQLPDAALPDAEMPDAAAPDAAAPDAAAPDAELPDAQLPDAQLPDAEIPDAEVPDAQLPDAELPDAELPDAELPDAEIPDAEIPDAEIPDMGCLPSEEACDGVDNDCDGRTDEGLAQINPIAITAPGAAISAIDGVWRAGRRITAVVIDGEGALHIAEAGDEDPGQADAPQIELPLGPVIDQPSVASAGAGGPHAVAYTVEGDPQSAWVEMVDEQGEPVGIGPLSLSDSGSRAIQPDLAWGGERLGAAWVDDRHGNDEIYVRWLTAAGEADGEPLRLSVALGRSTQPVITARPEGWSVVWIDDREGASWLYFAGLDDSGARYTEDRVIDGPRIRAVDVAWDGEAFGVFYGYEDLEQPLALRFARVSHQGEVISGLVDVAIGDAPRITFNGRQYVMTWRDAEGVSQIGRFTPDGEGAAGGPLGVSATAGAALISSPLADAVLAPGAEGLQHVTGILGGCSGQLACEIEGYAPITACGVGLCRQDAIPSACVEGWRQPCVPGAPSPVEFACDGADEDCNGVVDDPPRRAVEDALWITAPAAPRESEVAWTGDGVAVAWLDEGGLGAEVYFQRFSDDGQPLIPPRAITAHGGRAGSLHMIYTGFSYGLTWHDDRDGVDNIYFALLDDEGLLIGEEVAITDGPRRQQTPDLAFDGSRFTVIWRDLRGEDGNELYLTQLDLGGQRIVDQQRVTDDPASSVSPAIAARGAEGLGVVWRDSRGGQQALWFQALNSSGALEGAPQQLTFGRSPISPDLAWTGDGYGLTWVERSGGSDDIWFQRLDAEGGLVGDVTVISAGNSSALHPQIMWTGADFAVVWDEDIGGVFRESWFQRLDGQGQPVDAPLMLSAESWPSESPSLLFTGLEFMAFYDDFRNRQPELFMARGAFGGCGLIEGCRAAADEEIIDGRDNDCDGLLDERAP